MKTREKNVERRKVRPCPIRTIGFTGNLSARSVREPLIAVMSSHEIETFRVQGLRIAAKIPIRKSCVSMRQLAVHLKRINEVQVAVEGAHAICTPESLSKFTYTLNALRQHAFRKPYHTEYVYKGYEIESVPSLATIRHEPMRRTVSTLHARRALKARNRFGRWVSKEPEIRPNIDKNGEIHIVIIYSTQNPPPFHVKCEYHPSDNGSDGPEQPDNIFLKEPNRDPQIIMALREVSNREFGNNHKGQLRYSIDRQKHRTKSYDDKHLLVCLFFYIHINRLNISPDFYIGQRAKLLNFCKNKLNDSKFTLCSESYFTRCITGLENQRVGFENYIVKHERPPFRDEIGIPDMLFWYEIYIKIEEHFKEIIPQKKN